MCVLVCVCACVSTCDLTCLLLSKEIKNKQHCDRFCFTHNNKKQQTKKKKPLKGTTYRFCCLCGRGCLFVNHTFDFKNSFSPHQSMLKAFKNNPLILKGWGGVVVMMMMMMVVAVQSCQYRNHQTFLPSVAPSLFPPHTHFIFSSHTHNELSVLIQCVCVRGGSYNCPFMEGVCYFYSPRGFFSVHLFLHV